jgi:hypothetical protein
MFNERNLPLPEYLGGAPRGTVDPAVVAAANEMAAEQND